MIEGESSEETLLADGTLLFACMPPATMRKGCMSRTGTYQLRRLAVNATGMSLAGGNEAMVTE
jgi:hypothetical protein